MYVLLGAVTIVVAEANEESIEIAKVDEILIFYLYVGVNIARRLWVKFHKTNTKQNHNIYVYIFFFSNHKAERLIFI